jgi:hypothetical protein
LCIRKVHDEAFATSDDIDALSAHSPRERIAPNGDIDPLYRHLRVVRRAVNTSRPVDSGQLDSITQDGGFEGVGGTPRHVGTAAGRCLQAQASGTPTTRPSSRSS